MLGARNVGDSWYITGVAAVRYQEGLDVAEAGGVEAVRGRDGDRFLAVGAAAQLFKSHQVAHLETVIEEAIASAKHGLGRLPLLMAVEGIGNGDARAPIAMVSGMILGFPTEAAREGKEGIELPIVLEEKRGIEDVLL